MAPHDPLFKRLLQAFFRDFLELVAPERIEGDLAGPGLTGFHYLSCGLARCRAVEYLAKPQPLAWALAALMDRRPWSRAQLKMNSLARIAEASLGEPARLELVNCVETYLQLSPDEAEESRLLLIPETRRAGAMLYKVTWADKMILEGKSLGLQQGLLGLLEDRFGPVPDEVKARIEKVRSVDRLTRLIQRAAKAKSLKSLRLG